MAKYLTLTRLPWLLVSGFWIAIDLWTKNLAELYLQGQPDINILPFLRWKYAENPGAAFSILSGNRWLLLAIGVVVSVLLLIALLRPQPRAIFLSIGYASILGGALGNIYDRFVLGYVRDMISVYYTPWEFYFAIFNVADVAINVGVIAIIMDWIFTKKKT